MPKRASYVGDVGAAASSLPFIQYAAAAPSASYVDVFSLTEKDVARMRTSGLLTRSPGSVQRTQSATGTQLSNANLSGTAYPFDSNVSQKWVAAAGGAMIYLGSGSHVNGTAGTYSYFSEMPRYWSQAANQAWTGFDGLPNTNTVLGTGAGNDEWFALCSTGLFGISRSAPTTFTKYGTTAAGGSNSYTRLTYHKAGGRYLVWADATALTPKYSTDKTTWAACTFPTLNGDGGGADAYVVWIGYDDVNSRSVAVTAYGEILTSSDGIAFTKTYTRAAGSTSQGIKFAQVTNTGKLIARGTGLTSGQVFVGGVTTGFSATTVSGTGKTLAGLVGVAYSWGVIALMFAATATNSATGYVVTSSDDGGTWTSALDGSALGSGYSGRNIVGDAGAFYVFATNSTNVFLTILALGEARSIYGAGNQTLTAADGTSLKAWVKRQ